jgi:hypothetical protein
MRNGMKNGMIVNEEFEDITETFEELSNELCEVEKKLAIELGFSPDNARVELVRLSKEKKLIETALVAKWNELFTCYMHDKRKKDSS